MGSGLPSCTIGLGGHLSPSKTCKILSHAGGMQRSGLVLGKHVKVNEDEDLQIVIGNLKL